jgi:hypothetical protein
VAFGFGSRIGPGANSVFGLVHGAQDMGLRPICRASSIGACGVIRRGHLGRSPHD